MFAELMLGPFQAFLNRGLQQSAEAQALAGRLEGRVLGLTISGTPFDLRLKLSGGRLQVSLADAAAPDACMIGGPLSLGRLMREDPKSAIRDGALRMTGDSEVAEQFRELLRLSAPDFAAELGKLIGQPAAQQIGDAGRAFARWSETAGDNLASGIAEYLQKEAKVLPTAGEVGDFTRRVDELANDMERAAARIQRLEADR